MDDGVALDLYPQQRSLQVQGPSKGGLQGDFVVSGLRMF
jgi:hypothetical protein